MCLDCLGLKSSLGGGVIDDAVIPGKTRYQVLLFWNCDALLQNATRM